MKSGSAKDQQSFDEYTVTPQPAKSRSFRMTMQSTFARRADPTTTASSKSRDDHVGFKEHPHARPRGAASQGARGVAHADLVTSMVAGLWPAANQSRLRRRRVRRPAHPADVLRPEDPHTQQKAA